MSQPTPSAESGLKPLPEVLLGDLRELLTWDNNCFLTWVQAPSDVEGEPQRWFTVRLGSDGQKFGLRLEFWIPAWMSQRGVAAILPAHLEPSTFEPGRLAAVDLGLQPWPELERSLPKVSRTCARLMNELWGPATAREVLLLTLEYQDEQLEAPFTAIPGYGK